MGDWVRRAVRGVVFQHRVQGAPTVANAGGRYLEALGLPCGRWIQVTGACKGRPAHANANANANANTNTGFGVVVPCGSPDRKTRTARNLMATASTARDATALCVYVCAQADGQSVHTMHVLHGDPHPR